MALARDAEKKVAALASKSTTLATEDAGKQRDVAKASLRHLIALVPSGIDVDALTFARACFSRSDAEGAYASVQRWRDGMRAKGFLPA